MLFRWLSLLRLSLVSMRTLFTSLSFVFFLSLSACDSSSNNQQPSEITLGLAAPLTGTSTRAGQDMRIAMEMAVALANEDLAEGAPSYRLSVEDTKSTTEGAEEAFRNLISNGAVFIVGPYSSANTNHIIPIIDEARVVTIAPASAAQGLSAKSDWLFRSSLTVDVLIPAGVRATQKYLDYNNVGVLTNAGDHFSQNAEDKFVEEIDQLSGVSVGMKQSFNRPGSDPVPDLTPQINALTSATPMLDALFFFGLAPDRHNFILKAHELGVTDLPFVITLLSTSDIRLAHESAPSSPEGVLALQVWISGSNHPTSQAYVKEHQRRYNGIPSDFSARAYAAADLLLRAISEVTPDNISNEAVRDRLALIRNIDTIYGPFSFDEDGDAEFTPLVGIVRGTDIVLLED